jgi:hypothetical protein
MNNIIPHTEGIDKPIQNLQTQLYNRLLINWGSNGLDGNSFEMYGRAYRNLSEKHGGFTPQVYSGNGEYNNDLFFDDKLAALMWFGLNDSEPVNGSSHTYNVSLYGFVNLDKLKPGTTASQRMDEAVLNDIVKVIEPSLFGFQVKEVFRDVDNVLAKYSGVIKKSASNRNFQPFACFRIDMVNMLALDYCNSKSINYPTIPPYMTTSLQVVFKDNPNTAIKQRLNNGVYVQLEYPTGNTVTIPFLVGRTFNWPVYLDASVYMTSANLPYSSGSGTFDNSANGGFGADSVMQIQVNVN